MKCSIKAFGISREIIGAKLFEIELPKGLSVGDFKKELFLKYPKLTDLRSLYVAVNNEYAADEVILHEQDEIALIPPVGGG